MKKLILCLLLVCSNTVYASPVTVIGVGETFEEAKKNGFRNAIENVAGSVILRNLDVKNYDTVRNELLVYSAGYIDNYTITSKIVSNNGSPRYELHMLVYVSKNKISKRLLTEYQNNNNFDNEQVQTTYQSVMDKRFDAHKILDSIFYDYPDRAFDLSHSYALAFNNRGNIILSIQYGFNWNPYFIDALKDTLASLEDADKHSAGMVSIGRNNYYFNDITYIDKIKESMTFANAYQLQLIIKDGQENVLYSQCYTPHTGKGQSMYSIGGINRVSFFPKDTNLGNIEFKLPNNIKSFTSYDLKIVAAYNCQR